MSKKQLALGLVFIFVLAAGWIGYSPYYTIHQIQKAAREGDAVGLERYVDFPALRASFKDQVLAQLNTRWGNAQAGRLAGLEIALVARLAGKMVDLLVTPQAIAKLAQGQSAFSSYSGQGELNATEAGLAAPIAVPQPGTSAAGTSSSRLAGRYLAYDRFEVQMREAAGNARGPRFLLIRSGIGWKLVSIELSQEDLVH
ncbi:MAG: DUF2939 domain-containing protein [Burkholderiaceae bacterium]